MCTCTCPFDINSFFRFLLLPFSFYFGGSGNTKGTTNSSKANDDNEKNAKKSNDDAAEPGNSTPLGEIPKVEKYIANTRIDGLQTLYQVHSLDMVSNLYATTAMCEFEFT